MRRPIAMIRLVSVVAVLFGLLALAVPSVGSASIRADDEVGWAGKDGKPKTPDHYTPRPGIKLNNPLGGFTASHTIRRHLLRTINSVPAGAKIRIASWNVRSAAVVTALINAHKRGVSVRVVLDRLNANPSHPNPDVARLTVGLKYNNAKRKPGRRSFVRRCVSSCRAPGGIAHTKFYLFSKAGRAKNIVMFGSANATDLAVTNQWNDLYTIIRSKNQYTEFNKVFKEMVRDVRSPQAYLTYTHGDYTSYFYPYRDKGAKGDPLLQELNKIRCKGATGGTGTNGRTKIRIAQTSMWGKRGVKIAERLMQMHNRGCDIKIVYAVFGNNVMWIFRHRGAQPMPFRQIAQDFNLDGLYDRYLHMKYMTVSGVYDGDTAANVIWNGSANWTGVALASDEIVMRILNDPEEVKTYADWVDWLYAHPPRFSREMALIRDARVSALEARGIEVDPYANMRAEQGIPDGVRLAP